MIELYYEGQLKDVRKLLIENKIATLEQLTTMEIADVEDLLNKNFDGYCPCGDQEIIYLVPKGTKISKLYASR